MITGITLGSYEIIFSNDWWNSQTISQARTLIAIIDNNVSCQLRQI